MKIMDIAALIGLPFEEFINGLSRSLTDGLRSDNDWPSITALVLFILIILAQCAIKLSVFIRDHGHVWQRRHVSRLAFLRRTRERHPGVLLDAEIDAEMAKLNEHDAWCRWRQEKKLTYHEQTAGQRLHRRRFSVCFASAYSVFWLAVWVLPCCIRIFPWQKDILLALIATTVTIWFIAYAVGHRLGCAMNKTDNPIAIWGLSWMSASLPFVAMLAVSVGQAPQRRTDGFFFRELALAAIVVMLVLVGFIVGHGFDYAVDRWLFVTRPHGNEHYHAPLCARTIRYGLAISNLSFWIALSFAYELLCSESVTNDILIFVFFLILSFLVFISAVAFLIFAMHIVLEFDFAMHGHQVHFHANHEDDDKPSTVIVACGLSSGTVYPTQPKPRSRYSFEGWNTQKDGSGKAIEIPEGLNKVLEQECGSIDLYAQWKACRRRRPLSRSRWRSKY